MLPEEHPREQSGWETSLPEARSALESGNTRTAPALLKKAIEDAAQMADHCHNKLVDMGPSLFAKESFADWERFLKMLYNDSWRVYKTHGDVVIEDRGEDLQATFEALSETALSALGRLQDMIHVKKLSRGPRENAIKGLQKLVAQLEAVKAKLGPQSEILEAHETARIIVPQRIVDVPLVGRIAAGDREIIAEESIEDRFPLPKQLVGEGMLFMLKITGDSMIDAAITDGDWVVVRQQPTAENGEIVAAMIGENATVKTFKRSGSETWLLPQNPRHTAIPGNQATILGKVVAVLRRV